MEMVLKVNLRMGTRIVNDFNVSGDLEVDYSTVMV